MVLSLLKGSLPKRDLLCTTLDEPNFILETKGSFGFCPIGETIKQVNHLFCHYGMNISVIVLQHFLRASLDNQGFLAT